MKKILIIIPSIKLGGGAEKIASLLCDKLKENGYNINLLTFFTCNLEYFYNVERFSLNENPNKLKAIKLFIRSKKIAELCKKNKIDTTISFLEAASIPLLASIFFGNETKKIISIRNNPLQFNSLLRFLVKIFYGKANKIVAINKNMRDILVEYFKLKKVEIIYNIINIKKSLQLMKENIPEEFNYLFHDSFVFINVGRLTKPKGQYYLIGAFKKVTEKYKNAKLIILGEGPLRKNLENLISKLNLKNNVFLLGNQENVFPFIKNSKCFVFSSLWESFGNALIEALVCNIPIISTDCKAGPRDILAPNLNVDDKINYPYYGKYGIFTEPFEPKETERESEISRKEEIMARIMTEIIKNKKLKERYSNGFKRAVDFDADSIISNWIKIIEEN